MTDDTVSSFADQCLPLLELFPAVMLLDRELRVRFASNTLLRHVPALEQNPALTDAFQLSRPRSVANYDDALRHISSLFLMTSADGAFAVRGQLISYPCNGEDVLVFCGSPWLSWMVSKQPETRLGLQDFAPQDVQLDQLFYMSTEARMVEDLEALNTELRDAKVQVERAQSAKDAFFARMSHEMRTPLNGVISALTLMRDELPEGRAGELLELASTSSGNLMEVINYVLDVSRLESGEADEEDTPFQLEQLLNGVIDVVRAQAVEKGLVLSLDRDPALPRWWCGNEGRLKQSLLNLLINAVKFTPAGRVVLRAESAGDASPSIRLEVQDTGLGIPKSEQAKIFEPFTRVAGSSEPGTGLGLDIVRRNVASMGGRVGVSSAPGAGSTFWIETPLEPIPPQHEPALAPQAHSGAEHAALHGHVLLVDDNETNCMLNGMILESLGLTVEQANSGEQAVSKALQGDYDLILMDISMPDMDGHEATRLIRRQRDERALPIVALSAYASGPEREKSAACGMNGYLTKPIQRDQLVGLLSQWLCSSDSPGYAVDGGHDPRDSGPCVDLEVVEHLFEQIGAENLVVVIGKFVQEAALRWSALQAAPDCEQLAREAHSLASTCRSFGLVPLADSLNQVESDARAGATLDGRRAALLGDALEEGLTQLESAVAAVCEGRA